MFFAHLVKLFVVRKPTASDESVSMSDTRQTDLVINGAVNGDLASDVAVASDGDSFEKRRPVKFFQPQDSLEENTMGSEDRESGATDEYKDEARDQFECASLSNVNSRSSLDLGRPRLYRYTTVLVLC